MASPIDVARYLIRLASSGEEPEGLTHMRLQKLLYYVQGWALATFGRPLFEGRIEAWKDGPVVRQVDADFADHKGQAIPSERGDVPPALSARDRSFIASVWKEYRRYSAAELREKTHREPPWLEARGGLPEGAECDAEITAESMRRYFAPLLEGKVHPGLSPEAVYEGLEQLERGEGRPAADAFRRARMHAHGL